MSETMTQADQYEGWRRLLAGERVELHPNPEDALSGFYRVRRGKDGAFEPVSIFRDDSGLQFVRGGKVVDGAEVWPFCAKYPVTYQDYEAVAERNEQWSDVNDAVVGHNRAPVGDTPEAILDRVADLEREAEKLIKVGAATTQAAADQASDVANTFGELETRAIRLHKDEKDPHLEAGRVVDRKWFPIRDKAADLKRRLKAVVVTPFLTKKREEQERAQVAAVQSGAAPDTVAPVRAVAGSSKRSSGLRTYYRAEIEDKAKLLDSLKDHPEVVACIRSIANAAAAKKIALPGCKIVSEQRAA